MKLYEIADRIEMIFADPEVFDPETGTITDTGVKALGELEDDAKDTGLEIATYIKGLIAEADCVKSELEKLKTREKGLRNRADSLKVYLKIHLERSGFAKQRLADGRTVITWSSSASASIESETAIPKRYFNSKKVVTLNRALIRSDLMEGHEVAGCSLVRTKRVVIK